MQNVDTRRMRICMINDNYYRSSGAAIAIRRISEALPEVDWFFAGCADEGLNEDLAWITPSERYQRFDLKTSNVLRLAMESVRFRRWFRENSLDLVNCHHRRIAAILHVIGIPVLYTGNLVFPYERWFRWFHPRYMTAITASVAKNLLRNTGEKVLACISNPVAFSSEPPRIPVQQVADQAICIARLDPVKAHVHLLEAWKILHSRGHSYHLNLLGEGSLKDQLQEQAVRAGISHLVHFLGFTENVRAVIAKNLFAVLASEYEGQGIVTLEAAALGRPSLLTAVPGSIDLISKNPGLPNGVPFGDAGALADALEIWFASPEQVVKEGQRFFREMKEVSDSVRVGQAYKRTYAQVIATQRGNAKVDV